jgi:hypothetical protein
MPGPIIPIRRKVQEQVGCGCGGVSVSPIRTAGPSILLLFFIFLFNFIYILYTIRLTVEDAANTTYHRTDHQYSQYLWEKTTRILQLGSAMEEP